MVLGKVYRVAHKIDKESYSVILEHRSDKSESLLFEAETVAILSAQEADSIRQNYCTVIDVYGCLGVLQLPAGDTHTRLYLVLINGCVSVGKIREVEIFRITDTAFLSLRNNNADYEKIVELRRILNSGTFYFATKTGSITRTGTTKPEGNEFSLTLCAQRLVQTSETDNRFFWNRFLHLYLLRYGVDTKRWSVETMSGAVFISTVYVGSVQAKACLISRLSSERAGARFHVRGVDDRGHVANFVETEQVIYLGPFRLCSYIITRGSVPLFWEQPGVNVGSHKVRLSRGSEISQAAFDSHLKHQRTRYGRQILVNLLGSKEGEAVLGKMYRAHHKASRWGKEMKLVNFDYHAYCSRGNKSNLERKLRPEIGRGLEEFGFYLTDENGLEMERQSGTFRVNCVDCLDRTGSVQTYIGFQILKKQLEALCLTEKPSLISRFEEVYKNMWIQNGDSISRIYAGTGALEGKSKIKDSTLSVARTIQNNLLDSGKQEAMELLLDEILTGCYERARSLLPLKYLHLPPTILLPLLERSPDYTHPKLIRISVGTWNVNGGMHFNSILYKRSDPLSDWLLDHSRSQPSTPNLMDLSLDNSLGHISEDDVSKPSDIFAIGFQEIVDLSAGNIVAASTSNQREWMRELQNTISRETPYVLVTSVQLVGVCLFLFTRPQHAPFIKEVSIDQVKTGLGGATGNKGGVAIRLLFYNSSAVFVCSHFAAGQSQVAERNGDYGEITRRMTFPPFTRSLNSHDYTFWFGDFNYRLNLSREEAKELVLFGDVETLLQSDQLKAQMADGKAFRNYIEGDIKFLPTYKYDLHSDDFDTSEKARVPAYTDRILFKKHKFYHQDSKGWGRIIHYGRAELKTSDHRPVILQLDVELLKIDEDVELDDILEEVAEKVGPLDATILIKHPLGVDAMEEDIFSSLLKYLADEAGEIITARLSEFGFKVTFRESSSALKSVNRSLPSNLFPELTIQLLTPNYVERIKQEVALMKDNTVPLTGEELETNEDEFKFELSLGPETIAEDLVNDDEEEEGTLKGPLPQRPLPPSRPPPPSKIQDDGNNQKPVPVRPAPPPPKPPAPTKWDEPTSAPTKPAPPPPLEFVNSPAPAKSTPTPPYDSWITQTSARLMDPWDASNLDPWDAPPPPPPPRIDSFEDPPDDQVGEEVDAPYSPWMDLPPAPPVPPVDLADDGDGKVPPIPERPKLVSGQRMTKVPPPLPARNKQPPGPPSHPPPSIPPKRVA